MMLGEVSEPRACLQAIQLVLRLGGLLSITEMQGDPDAPGQEEIQQLAHQCGFTLLETFSLFNRFMLNSKSGRPRLLSDAISRRQPAACPDREAL